MQCQSVQQPSAHLAATSAGTTVPGGERSWPLKRHPRAMQNANERSQRTPPPQRFSPVCAAPHHTVASKPLAAGSDLNRPTYRMSRAAVSCAATPLPRRRNPIWHAPMPHAQSALSGVLVVQVRTAPRVLAVENALAQCEGTAVRSERDPGNSRGERGPPPGVHPGRSQRCLSGTGAGKRKSLRDTEMEQTTGIATDAVRRRPHVAGRHKACVGGTARRGKGISASQALACESGARFEDRTTRRPESAPPPEAKQWRPRATEQPPPQPGAAWPVTTYPAPHTQDVDGEGALSGASRASAWKSTYKHTGRPMHDVPWSRVRKDQLPAATAPPVRLPALERETHPAIADDEVPTEHLAQAPTMLGGEAV